MKREINVFDYSKEIMDALKTGVLITSKADGRVNSMTIAWGMLGIEWGKPIFITFVREGRYTRKLLDKSMEFTVNIPLGDHDRKIIGFCGSKSGRTVDKHAELGLTVMEPDCISAPAIKELPLTLECRVIYKQLQDKAAIPTDIIERNYPEDVGSENPMANRDYHIAYYGEIVKAYIIEE